MGFFDRPPPVAQPERERHRRPRPAWIKPEAALPGVVATEFVLARTPDAAVAVIGLSTYPTGFEFSVCAVLREDRRRRGADWGVMHPLPDLFRDEPLPDEFLRLGLRFSDGRAATNVGPPIWSSEFEPAGVLLLADGGGGGAPTGHAGCGRCRHPDR